MTTTAQALEQVRRAIEAKLAASVKNSKRFASGSVQARTAEIQTQKLARQLVALDEAISHFSEQ